MALVLIFLTFISINWYLTSSHKTVHIGVISTSDVDYEKYNYLASQAEKELNSLSRHNNKNIVFNFTVFSGSSDMLSPYRIIKHNWETQSMNLFVAGRGSQLTVMRSFLDDNRILVLSLESETPQLSQEDFQRKFIFRLSPDYLQYHSLMARFAIDYGLDQAIITGFDYYIDIEGDIFADEFKQLGGEILGVFSYSRFSNSSIVDQDLEECLFEAEELLKQVDSNESVGVFFIGGYELEDFIAESNSYPYFSNVTWLSLDAYDFHEDVLQGIGSKLNNSILISAQPITVENEKTKQMNPDFHSLFGSELDFYTANVYDSCMILGLSVIEEDSVNSTMIRNVLPTVAEDYIGLTGSCGLDSHGDRRAFRTGFYSLSLDETDFWKAIGYLDNTSYHIR